LLAALWVALASSQACQWRSAATHTNFPESVLDQINRTRIAPTPGQSGGSASDQRAAPDPAAIPVVDLLEPCRSPATAAYDAVMARIPHTRLTAAIILGLMVWVAFVAFRNDRVSARLGKHVEADQPVDFASVWDSDWDRVYFFPPYSPASDIERTLGIQWPGLGGSEIERSDGVTLIVFTRNGRVVRSFDHPRNQGDFSSLHRPAGFTKAEARFTVRRDGGARSPFIQVAGGEPTPTTNAAAPAFSTPASNR
jgi:hypothetical protein